MEDNLNMAIREAVLKSLQKKKDRWQSAGIFATMLRNAYDGCDY